MRKMRLWRECGKYRRVFYVMGNHEPYHFDVAETVPTLASVPRRGGAQCSDPRRRDRNIWRVRFIGGTLWTDMDAREPLAMMSAQLGMNDYATIRDNGSRLTPAMTVARHKRTVAFWSANWQPTGRRWSSRIIRRRSSVSTGHTPPTIWTPHSRRTCTD